MKQLLFIGIWLFILGCTPGEKKEVAKTQLLYDQVMDVHDAVMPRMGEVNRLKRELRDAISQAPDMVIKRKEKIERAILLLDAADKAMMDWMHEFEPLPDSAQIKEARAYLKDEMVRIREVKAMILAAIDSAQHIGQ